MRKTFRLLVILCLIIGVLQNHPGVSYAADPDPTIVNYMFEDNVNDSSGNAKHGSIRGSAGGVTYTTGYSGKAALFNGNGYIEMPNNLIRGTQDFTISFMFNTTSHGAILGYQNEPALTDVDEVFEWIPMIYIDTDGKLRVYFWSGSRSQTITTGVVNDGQWHKVTLNVGANLIRLYLDDQFIGERNSPVNHLTKIYNQLGVADSDGYSKANSDWFYYQGMLDDFILVAGTFTIGTIADQTASPLADGYASGTQQTKTISITNNGTGNLSNVAVALSGVNASDFQITSPLVTTLNNGVSTSFTIKAKDGLAVGTYTATVTVSADRITDETFTITQVVNVPPPVGIPQNVVAVAGNQQID